MHDFLAYIDNYNKRDTTNGNGFWKLYTLHKSGENKTNNPRALYACVYSSKPLGKDFDQGYYDEPFPNK